MTAGSHGLNPLTQLAKAAEGLADRQNIPAVGENITRWKPTAWLEF